jgi:Domain of unknown function (DUF397)
VSETDLSTTTWRKSSFSEAGNCVEVADRGNLILVRDTKLAARSTVLAFSSPQWREFTDALNEGLLPG